MKRHVASMSTSSGSHRLSNENDIDIKLYEALGKNIVFTLGMIGDQITKIVSNSYMLSIILLVSFSPLHIYICSR